MVFLPTVQSLPPNYYIPIMNYPTVRPMALFSQD